MRIDPSEYERGIAKLEHLEALIVSNSGPGFDSYMSMNRSLQENLVELAADLVQEARRLLSPSP